MYVFSKIRPSKVSSVSTKILELSEILSIYWEERIKLSLIPFICQNKRKMFEDKQNSGSAPSKLFTGEKDLNQCKRTANKEK